MTNDQRILLAIMADPAGKPQAIGMADREAIGTCFEERSLLLEACENLASIAEGQFRPNGLSALAALDHARRIIALARGDKP
jgi:hypothetical protein